VSESGPDGAPRELFVCPVSEITVGAFAGVLFLMLIGLLGLLMYGTDRDGALRCLGFSRCQTTRVVYPRIVERVVILVPPLPPSRPLIESSVRLQDPSTTGAIRRKKGR
jgi:hypothetical protein